MAALLSFLSSSLFKYLAVGTVVVLLVFFGVKSIERLGYEKGVASQSKTIQTLNDRFTEVTGERNQLQRELAALKETQHNADEAHAKAIAQQQQDTAKIVAEAKATLDKANADLKTWKSKYANSQEVIKYVTPQADARAVIPDGFVWLYNRPFNTDPAATGLPEGGPTDVDADSGLAASEVARIAGENNALCEYRKTVIESWQTWYAKSYTAWSKAVAVQGAFKVVTP